MEKTELIESGILELYVFGTLTEVENKEVAESAKKHPEVAAEILSIEKAVINLSDSFAPYLSAENYEKIRKQLIEKHSKVIPIGEKEETSNSFRYIGWAASILLLLGIGFLGYQLNQKEQLLAQNLKEKSDLEQNLALVQAQNEHSNQALAIVRNDDNMAIKLAGQAIDSTASAKVYWNKNTQVAYVDAAGLPDPPKGKVYQVWALKLNPLTPTSIGVLSDFTAENLKIFSVANVADAEAFGITLEPEGGSKTPTLEQLYTLGKV